ncbi:MAG: hypothetical protein NUV86_09620 [Candidatus Scalindua sp.]|nr:hypothetical protein [Candidatus Scalindua sp.]
MKNLSQAKVNRNHIEVRLKLTDRHGVVRTYLKGTIKRFMSKLRGSCGRRIEIRVTYGREKDVFGKEVQFTNEYDGFNQEDAIKALKAFLEPS